MTIRGLAAATDPPVSPTTVSRIENPESTGAGSPRIDTLEALAEALECPLCELVGEPVEIEYEVSGDWPDALVEVLTERGGFVSTVERAWIESKLALLRTASRDDGLDIDSVDPSWWREALERFRRSARWRLVERLAGFDGSVLDGQDVYLSALDRFIEQLVAIVRADSSAAMETIMKAGREDDQ